MANFSKRRRTSLHITLDSFLLSRQHIGATPIKSYSNSFLSSTRGHEVFSAILNRCYVSEYFIQKQKPLLLPVERSVFILQMGLVEFLLSLPVHVCKLRLKFIFRVPSKCKFYYCFWLLALKVKILPSLVNSKSGWNK